MKVIAIANQKDGVANITTTHNLSVALGAKGKGVLLIDLDSQSSLTISVSLEPLEIKRTIAMRCVKISLFAIVQIRYIAIWFCIH